MRNEFKNKNCSENETKEEIDYALLEHYFSGVSKKFKIDLEYF
jgi:hypothetical protein